MNSFPQLYSKERINQFINKYQNQILIDPSKEIQCGIINLDELHIAGII